jgi:hypothetical protein
MQNDIAYAMPWQCMLSLSMCMHDLNVTNKYYNWVKVTEMGQRRTLKNVNSCLNDIYSYLETSGGQSSSLYLNVVHFINASVNKTFLAA